MKFEICVELDAGCLWYEVNGSDAAMSLAKRQIKRRGAKRVIVYGPTGAVEAELEN